MQKNRPTASDVENFVEASARLHGFDHRERIALWRDRLAMNDPELAVLSRLDIDNADPVRFLDYVPSSIFLPVGSQILDKASKIACGVLMADELLSKTIDKLHAGRHLNAVNYVDHAPITTASGPLSGIPFAVKDLVSVAGMPLTDGSSGSRIPNTDAPAVGRLRKLGAYPIAMANLHELAFGITSENAHYGDVVNPRHEGRIAGGSSGGSAALVAAEIVDFAIGTDTAGSIRIPAAFCGVVGFKPSFGAVPRQGVTALSWSLDHVGPIAATVADIAVAFAAMAGLETRPPSPSSRDTVLRLIRPSGFFFEKCESSVLSALEKALGKLQDAGVDIETSDIAGVEQAAAAQFAVLAPEAYESHRWRLERNPEGLSDDVRVRLEIGQFMRSADYVRAQRYRSALSDRMNAAMGNDGLIVTPAVPIGAPATGTRKVTINRVEYPLHTIATRCTAPFNLTGMPAIVLPCGQDSDGLPVGLQIAAPFNHDDRLLAAAARVEAILGESGIVHARA